MTGDSNTLAIMLFSEILGTDRKMVAISAAGRQAREAALGAIAPMITQVVEQLGEDKARAALPILRELRNQLG